MEQGQLTRPRRDGRVARDGTPRGGVDATAIACTTAAHQSRWRSADGMSSRGPCFVAKGLDHTTEASDSLKGGSKNGRGTRQHRCSCCGLLVAVRGLATAVLGSGSLGAGSVRRSRTGVVTFARWRPLRPFGFNVRDGCGGGGGDTSDTGGGGGVGGGMPSTECWSRGCAASTAAAAVGQAVLIQYSSSTVAVST